ncbi:MAG: MFS transporter [Lewinellaceae bacterium]|nr:MFS transporter [Lewinellaceae bacterium]
MTKPKLSITSIVNMSVGFFGIQFGFALQNGNVSRIFQTLGAAIDDIPILWVAAPMTGLIVQPIIGYFSDRTWHQKWGRRRPFFFIGALLASLALLFMPNSSSLWIAAGMLWILDASINISMEPFRAFVGDNLPNEQRTVGFAMQSFFIGAGAYIASWLPTIFDHFGVANTASEGMVPDTVKYSFYIGGIVFFLSVLYTVLTSKEYSPEELRSFGQEDEAVHSQGSGSLTKSNLFLPIGILMLLVGMALSILIYNNDLKKDLYILSFGIISLFGLLFLIAGILVKSGVKNNGFTNIMNDFLTMPKTMKQLAFVQFFSWFALFAFWIYATAAITQHIYGTTDTQSEIFNQGANTVSGMMGNYNLIAAIVAFFIPVVAAKTSRKFAHFLALTLGGLGLISIYFLGQGLTLQWLPMIGLGIAWSSILSVPYAILSGALPAEKMGYYMGVFNFFIVIPQLVAASLLGFILTTFFDGHPIYALIVGGVSMILAGILTFFVSDRQD